MISRIRVKTQVILNFCWLDAGQTSATLAQRLTNIILTCRVETYFHMLGASPLHLSSPWSFTFALHFVIDIIRDQCTAQ